MGDEAFEVPLFPLDVVLFPGMPLPLHACELRDREMIVRCLDTDTPFGVVRTLVEHDSGCEATARVGTLARITDYERLPDGRYNLLATGTQRFEVLELSHVCSYLTARVHLLRDTDEPEALPRIHALAQDARCAFDTYLRTMLDLLSSDCQGDCPITIPTDPTELSFLIGMCLTCEDREKQALLETLTLAERLAKGTALLAAETEALTHQIECETRKAQQASADRARLN